MYIILIITIIISAIGAIYFKLEDDKKHLIKENTLEKKVIKYQSIIKLKDSLIKQKDDFILRRNIDVVVLTKEKHSLEDINKYQLQELNKLLKINQKLTKFITKIKSDAKDINKSN